MISRRAIDVNGQYQLTSTGGHATDRTMVPSVLLAIRTTRGSSPVAPTLGRKMARTPGTIRSTTPVEIKADIEGALAHLTGPGLIWDLTVDARLTSPTSVEVDVSFRDASGKQGPLRI